MWWGQGADPGEEPPPPPPPPLEEGNLNDQFQQQRDKLEELKELLKKNEEKQVSREKEVEKYASKLSDIKSRSKAAKRKATSTLKQEVQEQETETPKMEEMLEEAATPRKSSSAKKTQGNLVLLRKKLEENRAKFELRGKEMSENKKGIEEMVQHLKTQLDERDVKIKELQKVVEAGQSPVISSEASQDTDVLEAFDETQDVHAQVTLRDNKIVELKKKIVDLETKVLDLQENFREKDSVIAARTKAITLMSEDFSRRNKTAVDNLEETREEMRKMQKTFVEKEVSLNKEMEGLRKELTAKNLRLHQLEENNKELHSVQFDLSTRNAELQEKVVRMQEQTVQLQKQAAEQEEKLQHNEEAENLRSQLDDAQKQMTKMKAQHKTKVKNLNKQLDALKKMSDASEEILKLQNKIAELEEDKGNLQLHLVDFDELKVSESRWETRVNELEERVTQQSQDLDSHVHMIALLETEKLDHLKAIQEGKEQVINLDEEVDKMKTNLSELENQKLSLELKTVELEEQVDILNREKKELQDEVKTLSESNITAEKEYFEESSRKQVIVESVEVLETEKKHASLEGEFTVGNKTLVQLETELENSKRLIEEQKAIILELNSKIDLRDEELELQCEMITKLENLSSEDKEEKIMDIVKDLNEMASDLEEWKRRCSEVEKRLQDLGVEKDDLEDRFKDIKTENNMLKQQLHDQKKVATGLSSKLQEQSHAILNRDDKINSLQSMIELNGQTLEAREMTLKDVHEKLNTVEKQFEDRLSELQQVLANKESEIQDMMGVLTKQGEILKEKDNQILELTDALNKQKQETFNLQKHEDYIAANFKAQIDEMSNMLSGNHELIVNLTQECESYKERINELSLEISNKIQDTRQIESTAVKEVEMKLEMLESNLKCRDNELGALKTELESVQSELKDKSNKLKEVETKVAELTEKNKKFIANLKAKTVALKGQEQKIQQNETLIQTKENSIIELTSKNESLLAQLNDISNSASLEMHGLTERVKLLTNELNEEHSRTELIGDELSSATDKIVALETELKNSERKMQTMASLQEEHTALIARVAHLENELRVKDEELKLLRDEKLQLNNQETEKDSMLKEGVQKQAVSEEKIKGLEFEVATLNDELLKLKIERSSMLAQLSISYFSITNENSDNILQFDEVMELFMGILERNKQAVSASEAKVQEREAVIEFTEQELSKSKERIQHLEESLAFVEERRLSLENKAENLNLRLQESDRMKEEVFETEGMLEQRLKMLIASEESLKKKVSILGAENEDLSQKVAELMAQYAEVRKELVNAECILKDLQKETERLSPYEYSYSQAAEKIEHLESEMKRMLSEREHRMNEKVQNLQNQTESLEADLRNMNMELEKVEMEKRNLLEKFEKLNDEKLNLEDEIEGLNEQIVSYKSANETLIREKVTSAEVTKELEERIQYLESELQNKTMIQDEKEVLLNDLKEQIQALENEHKAGISTIESLSSSKEELNERIRQLENDLDERMKMFEVFCMEKEKALANLQEKIQTLEHEQESRTLTVSTMDMEAEISHLNAELDSLRSILLQKDNEMKSYQTRMLQLQFDTAPQSLKGPAQTSHLEETNSKLQTLLKEKEAQISDIHSVLNSSSMEIGNLRTKIAESENKLEILEREVERLREENLNKDNYLKQIQIASEVQNDMLLRSQYEEQLSILQQEKTEVYEELLRLKAQQEVSEIVLAAEDHVHRMTAVDTSQTDTNVKSVTFQEGIPEQVVSFEQTEVMSELENKIKELEKELLVIRNDRDEALLRLSQVSTQFHHPIESMPSAEMDDIILMIGEENAQVPQEVEKIDDETRLEEDNNKNVMGNESTTVSNTVVALEHQGWDTSEEEGWGWGSNEAKLEEEHIQKQQHSLLFSESADVLNKRVIDLEAQIKDLEIEREKLSEELHASQVRSGKMLKKLKDLKLKNDNLMKENLELAKKKTDKDFGDLDLAIEEELKIQIDTLEKEVKELKNEKETACVEKDGLMKRIDVLTSANERLIDGKERQDVDLEIWKQKNKELANELQSLEWRLGELEANTQEQKEETNSFFSWDKQGITSGDFSEVDLLGSKPQEQTEPQMVEFENLQILLEQERNFRTTAEMHLQELQQRLLDVNTEIELLANENADLKNQVERLHSQSTLVDQDNYNLQSAYNALHEEYQNHQKRLDETALSEDKYRDMLDEYIQKIDFLSNENKRLEEQYSNIQKELEDANEFKTHYMNLQSEYNNIKEHVAVLEKSLAFTDEQKLRLEQEVMQLKSLGDKESSNNTTDILSEQFTKIAELETQIRRKMEEVEIMRQVNENQKLEHAEAEQEWNSKMERLRKELEFNAENLLKQRDLHAMLQKEHEELRDHMNNVIENKVHEVISMKEQEIKTLKASLADSQRPEDLEKIAVIKQKLDESLQILNIRENDIKLLTNRLSEKYSEYNESLSLKDSDIENLRIQLLDTERRMSELLGQKDNDIHNLKIQLEERDLKITELKQLLSEEGDQLIELRKIVEDYEAQMKWLRNESEVSNSQALSSLSYQDNVPTSTIENRLPDETDEGNRSDPQKELDLALYMLHQRDVRCDELTLELMQLLEERDTLQLRLSNALRLNEELRNASRTSTSPVKIVMSEAAEKFLSSSREESPQHLAATVASSTAATPKEMEEDLQSLANKLSELHSVGYHRDVTLQDEREQRHSEQVRLLHQRGSGIVVDANYTLSRDVQSPSTVLLNWIWGRSTPRVMHV